MTISMKYPNVVKAFNDFLKNYLYPEIEESHVFYGNQNNITLPEDNDYCIFYIQNSLKTSTTIEKYHSDEETLEFLGKEEIVCRVDVYCSSLNGDNNLTAIQRAQNIGILFKSVYGVELFKGSDVTPLYTDDVSDTSLPSSDSGNYLFRASINLHAYINHSLYLDVLGFEQNPIIRLNSIVSKGDHPQGNDLNVANVDVKIKE